MTLVGYSDSEDSDNEVLQHVAPVAAPKRLERTDAKKIRVDLSSLQPDPTTENVTEPVPKKQRTGGTFSGFNSLLPAPKRATLKPGINLRTSSEAAFSRVPPPRLESTGALNDGEGESVIASTPSLLQEEVKVVGKTTRFLPLSVANAKKKKQRPPAVVPVTSERTTETSEREAQLLTVEYTSAASQPKTKQSLFSISANDSGMLSASTTPYEPEFTQKIDPSPETMAIAEVDPGHAPQGSTLNAVASDLNLSASERRRLFGRHGQTSEVKIAHFDMDSEYRANQDLAAKGEAIEHRAVKAIAPGKHSLQQLINNVKGQTDALEDKWAEGKRNRGETGSKYGW